MQNLEEIQVSYGL